MKKHKNVIYIQGEKSKEIDSRLKMSSLADKTFKELKKIW